MILRTPSSASFGSPNWLIALSWDSAQQFSQAVITGIEQRERERVVDALQGLSGLDDPTHFLIILLQQFIECDYEGIKKHGVIFEGIERWMQAFSVQSSTSDTTDGILGMITKSVNKSSSVLSFHEMRLESCSRSLTYIAAIQKRLDSAKEGSPNDQPKPSADLMAHSQNDIESLLLEVRMYQKIADSALSVVSQRRLAFHFSSLELTYTSSRCQIFLCIKTIIRTRSSPKLVSHKQQLQKKTAQP